METETDGQCIELSIVLGLCYKNPLSRQWIDIVTKVYLSKDEDDSCGFSGTFLYHPNIVF